MLWLLLSTLKGATTEPKKKPQRVTKHEIFRGILVLSQPWYHYWLVNLKRFSCDSSYILDRIRNKVAIVLGGSSAYQLAAYWSWYVQFIYGWSILKSASIIKSVCYIPERERGAESYVQHLTAAGSIDWLIAIRCLTSREKVM